MLVVPQTVMFIYPELMKWILGGLLTLAVIMLSGKILFGFGHRMPQAEYFSQSRLPFITNFRASIMILTSICILAVDFASFPRSWAKTEAFGTSLMDVGVGCIVFSSGLVSAPMFGGGRSPSLLASIKAALSMLVLGLARLVLVKFSGYQEHVTEYGVHWNFFLTLAVMPLLANLVGRLVPVRRFITGGVILMVGFETALRMTGLQSFILEGHREGLLAMNKEGVSSLVGCLGLFMISCGYGTMIQNVRMANVKNRTKLLILKMLGVCLSAWCFYFACKYGGLLPSRRMMNLPFVLWCSAFSMTQLFLLFILDATFMSNPKQSVLFLSVNDNQLLMFLLANLGTGLTNMVFQTLLLPPERALGILLSYALVLSGTAVLLKRFKLILRLK